MMFDIILYRLDERLHQYFRIIKLTENGTDLSIGRVLEILSKGQGRQPRGQVRSN